jgi:hypothetical protein
MRGEVRQQALRQPVDAAGQGAVHEADMAAVPMDFERHGGGQLVGVGQCRYAGRKGSLAACSSRAGVSIVASSGPALLCA